jgi:hypothetical protein
LAADEAAKASARNQMVPSRARRTRGAGEGDNELSAATAVEAIVLPVSPRAIENEDYDSILPGAQYVHGPGATLESTLNFDDLEAPPSFERDDRTAPSEKNDNMEHATTSIVAELAPTNLHRSVKLQKMVEDRFDQERRRQVVVETVQAEPMNNEGDKMCGVTASSKCWFLLVVGLLVIVAVAVGAGVGAASGGDSGNSNPPKKHHPAVIVAIVVPKNQQRRHQFLGVLSSLRRSGLPFLKTTRTPCQILQHHHRTKPSIGWSILMRLIWIFLQ